MRKKLGNNVNAKWDAVLMLATDTATFPAAIFAGAPSTSGIAVLESQSAADHGVSEGAWGPALVTGLLSSLEEVSLTYDTHPQPLVRIFLAPKSIPA